MHATTTAAAAAAATTSTTAPVSSTTTKVGWKVAGGEEERVEEGKVEAGGEEAGSSGHDSAGSLSVTTRGSITVLDMTAWIKNEKSTGTGTGLRSGLGLGFGSVEKGTEQRTEKVVEQGSILSSEEEVGVGARRGLYSSGLAPVLGATDLSLAPVRVLEWKELDESKVTETNLV